MQLNLRPASVEPTPPFKVERSSYLTLLGPEKYANHFCASVNLSLHRLKLDPLQGGQEKPRRKGW